MTDWYNFHRNTHTVVVEANLSGGGITADENFRYQPKGF